MSSAMLSAALLAFCSALLVGQRAVWAIPFDSRVKICNQIEITFPRLSTDISLEALRTKFREQVDGCQYVNGDLAIRNFNADPNTEKPLDEKFREIDTDFLDSIEEIAGRLIIFRVNIAVLTFKNLRIIWGVNYAYNDQFYTMRFTHNRFPLSLELPKLTAIGAGQVIILGNTHRNLYHFLTKKVNWHLLSKSSIRKSWDLLAVSENGLRVGVKDENATQCHSSCGANCWSSSPNGCQMHDHQCKANVNCSACYSTFSATDRTKKNCCHDSCLGGCIGPGPKACHSCSQFNRDGSCDDACNVGDRVELLKLGDHLCVKKCPLPFLMSSVRNACDSQCLKSEKPHNGSCRVCKTCKTCEVQRPLLSVSDINKWQKDGCNQWSTKSSLEIGPNGLNGRKGSANFLAPLERLEIFYGRLIVKGVERMGFDNVGFLRNLEFVSDRLAIVSARVRYLGLARLQYVKSLLLMQVNGLCRAWYPARHIDKMSRLFKVSLQRVTFDDNSNECKTATCHSKCQTRECWGPGPDMCVRDNLWTP